MHHLILFFAIFLFASCEFQKTTKLFCVFGEPRKLTLGVEIDEINKIIKLEFHSSYIEVSPYYYTRKFKRFKNNTYFLKDGIHGDIHIKEISNINVIDNDDTNLYYYLTLCSYVIGTNSTVLLEALPISQIIIYI